MMMVINTLRDLILNTPDMKVLKGLLPQDDQTLKNELTRAFLSYLGAGQSIRRSRLRGRADLLSLSQKQELLEPRPGPGWPGARSRLSEVDLYGQLTRSGKVEAIKVHHLVPGCYEIMDELFLRVRASVDFGDGPELGV
jgi:hypothetical protein